MNKMKFSFFFFLFSFLFSLPYMYAKGSVDTEEQGTINDEWFLCVTAFDYSALPPARRVAGEMLTRDLVNRLNTVNYRQRVSPEIAFYESYAWRQSVLTTARALSNRQNERAQLFFQGHPEWRYKRNLQRIDTEIERLRLELAVKEAERPVVNHQPVFRLIQANIDGTFPEPPKPGGEYRFCQTHKADAFLTGEVREFHGRFFIRLELYTLYTQSYVYEDDIIFSIDDSGGAVEEIAARLMAFLSGTKPSAVTVRAYPPESQILINQNFAGTGVAPTRERSPGIVTVAVTAEGYKSESIEVELTPGEHIELDMHLSPLQYAEVSINVPEEENVLVYEGAIFRGVAPHTLKLPVDQLVYVTAEQSDGSIARAVFISPEYPEQTYDLSFSLTTLPPAGEQRVNKARSRAYWAWGSIWLTLITAWISNGIYTSQVEALAYEYSDDLAARVNVTNAVRISAFGLVGAAITYNLVQMPRYIRAASGKAVPIVRQERNKK